MQDGIECNTVFSGKGTKCEFKRRDHKMRGMLRCFFQPAENLSEKTSNDLCGARSDISLWKFMTKGTWRNRLVCILLVLEVRRLSFLSTAWHLDVFIQTKYIDLYVESYTAKSHIMYLTFYCWEKYHYKRLRQHNWNEYFEEISWIHTSWLWDKVFFCLVIKISDQQVRIWSRGGGGTFRGQKLPMWQSEPLAVGVQGPGPGSFWVINVQICILLYSRDPFL